MSRRVSRFSESKGSKDGQPLGQRLTQDLDGRPGGKIVGAHGADRLVAEEDAVRVEIDRV